MTCHIRPMFWAPMIATLAGAAPVALADVIQPVAAGTVDCNGNVFTSLFRAKSFQSGCPTQGVLEFDIDGLDSVTSAVLGIRPDSIFNGTDPEDNFEDIVPLQLIAFPGDGQVTSADLQNCSDPCRRRRAHRRTPAIGPRRQSEVRGRPEHDRYRMRRRRDRGHGQLRVPRGHRLRSQPRRHRRG